MEGDQELDLEESRRILEEDDDDGEEEASDAEEEEEEDEIDSIQKLSSFTFHPEKKERGEGGKGLSKSPTRTLTRGARLTSHMDDDDDEDFEDDGKDDSIIRDNEESDEEFGVSKRVRTGRPSFSTSRYPNNDDNDDDDDDDEEDDNDDDNDVEAPPLEGVYDPREFDHLTVDPEVRDLFGFITKHRAQTIILDYKLKPFIPDFIPAVGDIDAFLKVNRPDMAADKLGLTVVDEPLAAQSDPSLLDLQLRAVTRHSAGKAARVKRVCGGEAAGKEVEKWISSISDLHRSKPPPSVNYRHPMPSIDRLMQEWPSEFESSLASMSAALPDSSAVPLQTYVDLVCGLLDIPVYRSRVESLHLLFSLYLTFTRSNHQFGQQEARNQISRGFLDPI